MNVKGYSLLFLKKSRATLMLLYMFSAPCNTSSLSFIPCGYLCMSMYIDRQHRLTVKSVTPELPDDKNPLLSGLGQLNIYGIHLNYPIIP